MVYLASPLYCNCPIILEDEVVDYSNSRNKNASKIHRPCGGNIREGTKIEKVKKKK